MATVNKIPGNPADPIVELDRVSYTHFGKKLPALSDVSLRLPRGSFTILAGSSGSGKSTLCHLLNGIIPHLLGGELTGRVCVDGRDVANTPVKDLALSVGLLFQDPELMFATLQVEDEVAFGPENLCRAPAEIVESVAAALDYTGLVPYRQRLVWALSGGQIQKLGLAAVLAMHTPLIVLDEPTANLDPATTQSVHELILRLKQEGTTVVLVTKELEEFMAEADNLIVLEDGKVRAQGEPRRVIQEQGQELLAELGIWLPEPVEIGLRLHERAMIGSSEIPLTVGEAAGLLAHAQFATAAPASDASPRKPGQVVVSARDVSFSYGKAEQALRGVSFQIGRGELLAIVGQNGAGKSTLSKLLVGLLRPTGGDLLLFGKPAAKWRVQELANHVAPVFQNPEHQFLCDTVYEELAYTLLAHGIDDPAIVRERVERMQENLDISATAQDHPFALSAGAKRRLGVATMLVGGKPDLLIVDEPTYGQDKRMTNRLMGLIRELRDDGITVAMITHDMRLVEAFAERAIVMADGRILFDGDPAQLFHSPELVSAASLRVRELRRLTGRLREGGLKPPEEARTVQAFVEGITRL